ncbi:MAG: hypothetical protein FIB08_12375 [Candidatus Methanoperedens sp.]|nr:hypothetical protein [Candidatus Methanoperedens sp.]
MKKYMKTICSIAIVTSIAMVVSLVSVAPATSIEQTKNNAEVKNIIFMVPDGMGLSDVTAARIYRNGINGVPLYLETLENIGYQRTYSADSTITDSAAAASTWACGEKFNNIEVCYHSDGRPNNPSILELARDEGKATGLVATFTITHATPAAFGAHVKERNCENEIARQYIEQTGPDVMLGGGVSKFNSTVPDVCGTSGDFITEARYKGYSVVYTKDEMQNAVRSGSGKLLGLFNDSYLVPESQRDTTTEPKLAEMTTAALEILDNNKKGFFLLVEGSQIDGANHYNNMAYQISEVLAFDDAVKVVLDWINEKPERKENTLLIIAPDHDTGGFAINGPYGSLLAAGEYPIPAWTTRMHTGIDTMIWSQGPGSKELGRAIDNTDVYNIMAKSLNKEDYKRNARDFIDRRIERGLKSLYKNQRPSGEFPTLVSYSPDMSNGTDATTVFETGFILHTLKIADNENSKEIIREMKSRAAGYLLDNKEAHGVWRFKGKAQPFYPPDTDDTSIAFAGLIESGVDMSDESLDYMLNYTTPEGVFYTWINSEEWLSPSNPYYGIFSMKIIDAGVNADALYAYSLRNRPQDGVVQYLNAMAENQSFKNGTIYYPSPYVFTYLVSKAYADGGVTELGPSAGKIREYVLETQEPDGSWGNDMDTAMAAVSLMNTGYKGKHLEKAIKHILSNQKKDGSWEPYAFYIAPLSPPMYYGSRELSTSFNLEALIKYKKLF